MELGRLYLMTDKPKPAAECFARVIYALDHPAEFGLDEQLKKSLLPLDEPGPSYQLMGECFLAADRPEDARAAFQKAEKAAPDKALWQFNLARVDAKIGNRPRPSRPWRRPLPHTWPAKARCPTKPWPMCSKNLAGNRN